MILSRLLSPHPSEEDRPLERFETLLARLEEIVAAMETADLPLDRLLSGYEEGMRLVKTCGERLAGAEQKVEILSRSAGIEPIKSPTVDTGSLQDAPAPGEDIRLF